MPPKRDPPPIEEALASITEALTKLNTTFTETQDAMRQQLAQHFEHTTALMTINTTKPETVINTTTPPTHGLDIRPPKLTLPTFNGSNPLDWLFQADQYFTFYNIEPPRRLAMIAFHLSGDALSWYKYLFNNRLLTTWEAFTRDLETRFGPSSYDNHQAALFKLRQTTTVSAYQTEFERLSNCVIGLPPEALLNCFISGLRLDIQQELAILRPYTITQAIGLAKLIEDKTNEQKFRPRYNNQNQNRTPPLALTPTPILSSTPSASTTTKPPLITTPPKQPQTLPYTRLSADALQQRRAAGLCFRCPERYHPGHKCNPPQFLLIVDNDDSLDTPILENTTPILPNHEHLTSTHLMFADNNPNNTITAPQYLSLSPAAFLGLASPKALRITAYIMGHPVTVLVDSGSTHNIIQPHIALFLKIPITPIPSFPVMVGNGNHIHCEGFCQSVVLNLQNTSFTIPFFVLPIEGANVVLGMSWLGSLGPILADFSVPTISFQSNGLTINLTGEPLSTPASPSTIQHLMQKEAVASMHTLIFQYENPPQIQTPTPHEDPHIQNILTDYSHIFEPPTSLPPPRLHDHHIPLKPNTPPVNVKPYRYPHYQKQIMTDLIKPSHSPYSSPVLLVRKKDGTWRFCFDYRALNAITIRDRFPIPTVDELLDELHGAQIFSMSL
ncbi:ty3-gypsy retrotransposon protein [Tanacetum coccineum]|uniref:Ty3-gypsy retrotransposon protein n=1 Tax=Tanacetum coccineum TaxID=301880 RepID=A0ABQ4Z6N5_9ASTR